MKKLTTCLWFDSQAEEAARFYTSVFKKSKFGTVTLYGEAASHASGRPKGSVLTVTFVIEGQEFMALNGGPVFSHSPAVSFVVNCETQAEIDELWRKLSDGGQIMECGWLTDRYGVTWQIVPAVVDRMLQDRDEEKTERVMRALLKMKKLDLAVLQRAYEKTSR